MAAKKTDKKWIQKAIKRPGAFTAKAKKANKTKKDEIQRNHSTKFKPLLICKPS